MFKHCVEKTHKSLYFEDFRILSSSYRIRYSLFIKEKHSTVNALDNSLPLMFLLTFMFQFITTYFDCPYIVTIRNKFLSRIYCTFLIICFTLQMVDGMFNQYISILFPLINAPGSDLILSI